MRKIIKDVCNLLNEAEPENTIMLSHADHDGFTSSVLLNTFFYRRFKQQAKIVYPSKIVSYFNIFQKILEIKPKYFFIVDALVARHKKLLERVSQNTLVINMDHHDIAELSSENYINLNPHKWGLEYMNSSGLCWLTLREIDKEYDKLCWLGGIGAIQDYCIEDNETLFKTLKEFDFIKSTKLEELVNSKLMKIAKMINATIRAGQVEHVYQKIFDAAINNKIDILEDDEILRKYYQIQEKELAGVYEKFKRRKKVFDDLIFFNLNDAPIQYISYIAERDKDKKIYVGYTKKGLLGLRSLFYNYDVRKLGRLFNGGGPHPKVAGGRTTKSFDEVIKIIRQYIQSEKTLRTLDDFIRV